MESEVKEHQQCVIIGSGPAGYTAAIYASRAELKPLVITGLEPGGQLMQTTDVDNFPGYSNGILGPDMMEDLKKQAERFGTEVRFGMVSKVDFSQRPFKIEVDDDYLIAADTIIISTGASAKWLGIDNEKELNGHGVSACAICDGFFYKGQDVVVVGAGDSAAEEASYLSKLCNKVYMLVRRDEMRASKAMQNRVENIANIEILYNHETKQLVGEKQLEKVIAFNNKTNKEKELDVSGFFVAIGHTPNTAIFKKFLNMDSTGYLDHKAGSTATNVEGIFVAGDCADKEYRQAITAAGTGCMAALEAERFLASQED